MINRTAKEVESLLAKIGGATVLAGRPFPWSYLYNTHGLKFHPVKIGASYSPAIQEVKEASGAYVICNSSAEILYVGESHTGRLYDTITRHFRTWNDTAERIHFTFDPAGAAVAIFTTEPGEAVALQNELIQKLRPKLNTNDGRSTADAAPRENDPF